MLVYPHINPVALKIGPLQIHWYGIMYVLGFGAAWWLARRRAARPGSTWKPNDVDDLIFWAMLGVIAGGRIGYVFFYGMEFWHADPWYPVKIWQGGMSFHGALIGVLASLALFARTRARNVLDVMDFTAPLPGLGIMAGRIGNFINGELWGRETTVAWGFAVPGAAGEAGTTRHATQLYEALLEGLLLFVLLWWFSARPRARGAVVGLGLMYYAVVRFLMEFLRLPDAQIGYLAWGWLTRGQQLSLPMLIGGALLFLLARRPSGNLLASR